MPVLAVPTHIQLLRGQLIGTVDPVGVFPRAEKQKCSYVRSWVCQENDLKSPVLCCQPQLAAPLARCLASCLQAWARGSRALWNQYSLTTEVSCNYMLRHIGRLSFLKPKKEFKRFWLVTDMGTLLNRHSPTRKPANCHSSLQNI